LLPGRKIANFEIVRWLGRGAFADVYEARQVLMDRAVALKVITGDQRPSEEQLSEARLLASLSHPNIIQIYDCGIDIDPDTGRACLYLATELVKGGTLRDLLASSGRLTVPQATGVALAVCEALAYAHARGVVHRDVKPENILLEEDGTPKLADFGVSRLLSGSQVASSIVGTAPYIAPEGWEGATHQSDIWSVGVLFYEMLRGAPPFTGKTPAEVERRIKRQAHTPLRELVPGIPAGVEAAIDKALQKKPSRRFAKVSDLADALRPYSTGPEQSPVTVPPGAIGTVGLTMRRAVRGVARFVAAQNAGTIVFLLVAALVGYLGVHSRGRLGIAKDTADRIAGRGSVAVLENPPATSMGDVGRGPTTRRASEGRPRGEAATADTEKVGGAAGKGSGTPQGQPSETPQHRTIAEARENADALYVQARAKLQTGEQTEAVSLLERCVAADPKHAAAHMQLAILHADLGKADRSVKELELVVGLEPNRLGARQMLARAYADQGEKEKAAAQWEAVLRLDPNNREAKQGLSGKPPG